jgi:DNA polymerase-3 subunit alpha
MRFVSLHHHSTFSFLDGFQLPEAHVRRAAEINMGSLALTEHGNIFGHVKLEKAAEAQGIKPIFGCEFYMGWTDPERRTQKKNHLTVVAKDAEGYENLLRLVTMSWREGFHYEPTVDWRWLVEHQKGLVVLSGCQGSALFTAMVGGKHVEPEDASYRRGLAVAKWFDKNFDDFYVEVQGFPELPETCRANPMLARVAAAIKRPLVATLDCHYTAPEEAEIQKILHNVRPGEKRTLEEQVQSWGYAVPLCPPATDMAIYRRLVGTGLTKEQAVEAIVSTEEIAQACSVTLPKLPRVNFPLPEGYETPTELWRDWLKEGWRYRGCHQLPEAERDRYKEQLQREMEVIEAKGYENYFLIVSDSIKFAKGAGIPVGPARGSAAASLACWLLRITEVNPMMFDNLVFERFIDWSREDMPDVDLDFATYGRPMVRDYLVEKYGEGCVNNIGTFTMYKSKMALDDAARVHRVPKADVEKVKSLLIERSSGDLRASATIEDTVDQFDTAYEVFTQHPELQFAMDLEGNAKGFGVHAAGLVISTKPITNVCALLEREVPAGSGNVVQVVSMDKYDAERQGLEKLDYLGLKTMDGIANAIHWLDMSIEELYSIPLDDEETIQGFRENDVTGIFQFDGRATRIVNGALKPDNFHELVCVNALSRPGPLHNGAVQGYVGAKWGTAEPERIHPALDLITADTQYQIIFQEQILRIVREIGDFSWTHSAYIRRIISKKLGDQEFNRQGEKFLEGSQTVHERLDVPPMSLAVAKQIWGMCITAGSYAFNAAHSTSYSMIAFWCMWLKRHHPEEFFAGFLSAIDTEDKVEGLMRDAAKHELDVLPPALDSDVSWRPEEGAIRAGWTQLPGIGKKVAGKIVAYEEQVGLETLNDLTNIPGIGPKTVEKIAAFTERDDPFEIRKLDESIAKVRKALESGELGKLPLPSHGSEEIYDAEPSARVTFLGKAVHRNLRDMFEANQAKTGVALKESEVKDAHLSQWLVLTVKDSNERATFVISRYKYPKFKEVIWSMDLEGDELVLLRGKKGGMRGSMTDKTGIVYVDDMWVIDPE